MTFNHHLDSLVGPIDGKFCYYFYFLALLSLFVTVFFAAKLVLSLFLKKYKFNVFNVHMCIHSFISYFLNRVLFNMCIRSLN